MNKTLLTLAALLAAFPIAGRAQQAPPAPPVTTSPSDTSPVTLRYKWTAGEVLHYKMTMGMDITMHMPSTGQAAPPPIHPMHMAMDTLIDQTVQSVDPATGAATILAHISQMTMTMNGQPMPNNPAMTSAGGYTTVMSPTGKVISVTMPPSAQGKMPAGFDMSKMGGMMPSALPDGPVKVGDTWNGTLDMAKLFGAMIPGGMANNPGMQINLVSALTDVAGGVANINQTLDGTMRTTIPMGKAGSMSMAGRIAGKTLLKFDTTAGCVASQDGTAKVSMNMGFTPAAGAPAGAKMPGPMNMQMAMTTHMERLP